jgi:hypothetical protein
MKTGFTPAMTQRKRAMPFVTTDHSISIDRARRSSPADQTGGGLVALDLVELRALIERLERSQRDLSARVARRAATLDTPVGAPRSDPLYQQLFFALAGLREQLASANRELARRTTARAGGWAGYLRQIRTLTRSRPNAATRNRRAPRTGPSIGSRSGEGYR